MADPVLSLADLVSGEVEGELEIRLYQAMTETVGVPQLSNFTEASYTGYVPQRISNPDAGVLQPDGSYMLRPPQSTFSVGVGPANPGCLVLGAYVVMTIDDEQAVAGFVEFGHAIEMREQGNFCQFSVVLSARDATIA